MTEIVRNMRLLSDSHSSVDTSECNNQDTYDIKFEITLSWFNSWLVWEGGIPFNFVYWLASLTIVFSVLHLLRHKFSSWEFLHKRFVGSSEPSPDIKPFSWADWLTLTIDEKAIGKDGATYLWFQYRLIQVYTWMMVFGVALITMHSYGDKLRFDNLLSSTMLSNVGLNGVHSIFSFAILATLAWVMTRLGNDRRIRTLASPDIPNTARVCNRHWLKITGLGLDTTIDSLHEYLKKRFNVHGIHHEGIVFANDLTKLWPILDQLNTVRDIKRQLVSSATGPELIQRRFGDKNTSEEEDAAAFYNRKENILLAEKDAIIKNLEFIGTAFIRFDDPAEAKALKMAIISYQSKWFINFFTTPQMKDRDFRLLNWTVQYAPPGSHINWRQLEGQQSVWKKLSVWLMLLIAYSTYITVMAAPGFIVRSLDLVGQGSNPVSLSWKIFILPNIVSFLTTELSDWVTNLDRYRHHFCLASIETGKLRSIFYLSTILYLIRMMAVQPLPLLFSGKFNSQDFRLECLFFPDHGRFIACSIIVNTASRILIDHTRLKFLLDYLKKWFTFRSQAEHTAWRKSYQLEYDFASRYAELTSNFVLTCLILIVFPVIGIVSWISSILIFLSDRSAMMQIYAVSCTNPDIHQGPVNIVMRLSILSPLSLLVYRIVQLGPNLRNHLLDDRLIAPLCVTILCALHIIYAHLRLFRKWIWIRRWIGYVEDDEEDAADLMINIQHEYDLVKALNFGIHQTI